MAEQITDQQILDLLFIIAPQFYTVDPVKIAQYEALIDALRCMVNINALGCCALLAFANLLAHYLTLQLNPLMGITNNISEGQLSLGIASTINSGFLSGTAYGQAYSQLIGNYKVGGFNTYSYRRFWLGPPCGC